MQSVEESARAVADLDRVYRLALSLAVTILVIVGVAGLAGEEGLGVWFLALFIQMVIISPFLLMILGARSAVASWRAWRRYREWQVLVLAMLALGAMLLPGLVLAHLVYVRLTGYGVSADGLVIYAAVAWLAHPLFAVPAALYWFRRGRPRFDVSRGG